MGTAKMRESVLKDIGQEIQQILYGYVKAESFTHSEKEKDAERYFTEYFAKQQYWRQHPEHMGRHPVENDPYGRAAAYAMVRGEGSDAIVFIHHNDVVTVEDFKRLTPFAFSPDELEKELLTLREAFTEEMRQDYDSGDWLFGRGVCDMKGGGSIQMAILSRYAQLVQEGKGAELPGTLILLAVPDEENLSAGMRSAVSLLAELKDRYGLNYKMMINSEPHQRKDPKKGVFSTGSIGKLMPFVYVRGYLAHAGKVFEGMNPLNLMSGIVRKTELNMAFSDTKGGEAAPPPTWMFLRDGKLNYDVSMPLSMKGCFSVLTLDQTPDQVLEKLRGICEETFDEVIKEMNGYYGEFLREGGQPQKALPWKSQVLDFAALCQTARRDYGKEFDEALEQEQMRLRGKLEKGQGTMIECNFELVDFVFDYIKELSPQVVYGLIPPYYPNVSNLLLGGLPEEIENISQLLNDFTQEEFGQEYVREHFYTGISDLSYSSISGGEEIEETLRAAMPFFGEIYSLPLQDVEKISMPCVNIGPWGKDFHKLTERVLKGDLYERTPQIIQRAIEIILG